MGYRDTGSLFHQPSEVLHGPRPREPVVFGWSETLPSRDESHPSTHPYRLPCSTSVHSTAVVSRRRVDRKPVSSGRVDTVTRPSRRHRDGTRKGITLEVGAGGTRTGREGLSASV